MGLSFLIADDEELCRNYIADLIPEYYPGAGIIKKAGNITQVKKTLAEHDIDVLFLDIKMPGESGIEFLQSLPDKSNFKTIFITAYNDYSISAIKCGAFDYLVKPIDEAEFKQTIGRLVDLFLTAQIQSGKTATTEPYLEQKLAVHHSKGFRFIKLGDIMYLQASNNYTNIQLKNGETVTVSKPLKEFETKLDNAWFFRIHKSYIINISYVDQYSSNNGGRVIMTTGEDIYISRYKLSEFFNFVAAFTKGLKA